MHKKIARILGIALVIVGILGFIPGITHREKLLGLFQVNAAHNLFHVATGLIAWWAGRTSLRASQIFFQIFGIIYAAIALLGFGCNGRKLLGFLANNLADAWLHLGLGLVFLYIGFIYKAK